VLRSYFRDRNVQIELGHEIISKKATRGCPQRPWPSLLEHYVRRAAPQARTRNFRQFVAYANDLIVVINGNSRKEIEQRRQEIVNEILDWCRLVKLEVSKNKTEEIALKNENVRRTPIGKRGGDRPDRKRKCVRERKVDLASRPPKIKIGNKSIGLKNSGILASG